MTCTKLAAKQGNTNGTCAADIEQIFTLWANKPENKIIEIMICSKSTANASASCKRNDTKDVC